MKLGAFFVSTFLISIYTCVIQADDYHHSCASEEDIPHISVFLDKCTEQDRRKIVVLPPALRTSALTDACRAKQLFVSKNENNVIVAIKKLFIMCESHKKNILAREIRSHDDKLEPTAPYDITCLQYNTDTKNIALIAGDHCYRADDVTRSLMIYTGADYTDPAYRAKGINTALTCHAFSCVRDTIASLRAQGNYSSLGLVYGLITDTENQPLLETRTRSIAQQFGQEIAALINEKSSLSLTCLRFRAYKPVFDDTGNLLSDDQCIPGYGHLLMYDFHDRESNA